MSRVVPGILLAIALGAWSAGAAGAARAPRPAIDVLTAAPNIVSDKGGAVVVRARVEHAVRCAFRGQRAAFASLTPCAAPSAASAPPSRR